jgi:type VI secretion system protein ImpH
MAAHGWGRTPGLTVEQALFGEGYRFDFYQAVALLEAIGGSTSVGEAADSRCEAVRFQSAVGFGFPPADVVSVRRGVEGAPARMTVAFLSLVGAMGPMPDPLAELVMRCAAQRDLGPAEFLDIFHHRLVSLRYRVRRRHRVALGVRSISESRAAAHLFATMGLFAPAPQEAALSPGGEGREVPEAAGDALRRRLRLDGRPLLHFAGLFATELRSMPGLTTMLRHRFEVPVQAVPLTGIYRDLDPNDRTVLAAASKKRLGDGAVLGRRVWDQQGAFELAIGRRDDPDQQLTHPQLLGFLPATRGVPAGDMLAPFAEVVRFYAGPHLDFSLRLVVEPQGAPQASLGRSTVNHVRPGNGPRLGYTAWVGKRRTASKSLEIRIRSRQIRAAAEG